ncbi:HlyD family type I secretion periplasmic adaptor subunit [Azospirillum agricola]|uniref:HlyD family type I secretion periplasmic adaptor subunit n=1 Tax=Azospirillum agricola TaxID=1720247 RepID=UPI000A0F0CAB|nr:HlyD family type I secretion periplasmic adaptor subunit [Azospirillum agricola]SMH28179.1 hemolysin D [Azospirillum lipoferum]
MASPDGAAEAAPPAAEAPSPQPARRAARPLRRRLGHELEFLPAALEAVETPASPVARAVALLIALFAFIALAWAWIGHIDITAVTRGRVIPSERNKLVQPLEPGIVRSIHVVEGQRVEEGARLLELDPTDSAADAGRAEWELEVAETEAARLRAALAGERQFQPPEQADAALVTLQRSILVNQLTAREAGLSAIDSQERQRRAEKAALAAEKARLAATLPLIREQVQAKRGLSQRGYSPRFDLLELEKELAEVEFGGVAARNREEEVDAALKGLGDERRRVVAEFEGKAMTDLADAENRIAALRQELTKAHRRRARQVMTAPVAGVVQQLAVHTVGGVVTTAEPLMVIVPASRTLIVETQVDNKDIGFLRPGMPAAVKVDAFPFTRYGLLPGVVMGVSHDVILPPDGAAARTGATDPAASANPDGPKFAARIALDRAVIRGEDGEDIALAPGMAVTAEIKTGRRRILDYLLSPVLAHVHDAMRER